MLIICSTNATRGSCHKNKLKLQTNYETGTDYQPLCNSSAHGTILQTNQAPNEASLRLMIFCNSLKCMRFLIDSLSPRPRWLVVKIGYLLESFRPRCLGRCPVQEASNSSVKQGDAHIFVQTSVILKKVSCNLTKEYKPSDLCFCLIH